MLVKMEDKQGQKLNGKGHPDVVMGNIIGSKATG